MNTFKNPYKKIGAQTHYGPRMWKHQVRRNKPSRGRQDVLEVTRTLGRIRSSSKEYSVKEASQQTS